MAVKSKSATQLYFNKDHDMVRKAVREFVEKEINPNIAPVAKPIGIITKLIG